MMNRLIGGRHGLLVDGILLGLFIVLAYVYFSRKGSGGGFGSPHSPETGVQKRFSNDFRKHGLFNEELKKIEKKDDSYQDYQEESPPVEEEGRSNEKSIGGRSKVVEAGEVEEADENQRMNPAAKGGGEDQLVDPRIRKIKDSRDANCVRDFSQVNLEPVSIIMDFYDYQFYDLKMTIGSILLNTPGELIGEIIVVDDGSTLDYIVEEAKAFIEKLERAQLIRQERQTGVGRARNRGASIAKSQYLAFISSNVVCNRGWLEPLLRMLKREPTAIATPHYDAINDPVSYQYVPLKENLVTTFTWSLTSRMTVSRATSATPTSVYGSPTVRGDAFVVAKVFYARLGGYDEQFKDIGGENLELSLRTWMCGGIIRVSPCSRVGVLNLRDPVMINSKRNVVRIAQLWMDDDRREIVFRNLNVDRQIVQSDDESVQATKKSLRARLKCKDLSWYLGKHALSMPTPTENARKFGVLRSLSKLCAKFATDGKFDLVGCEMQTFEIHPPEMTAELTKDGHLIVSGRCLTVKDSAYVMLEECREGNQRQIFEYTDSKNLVNTWSHYCLMHVTDPQHTAKQRQIVMVQQCDNDKTGTFKIWDFMPL